MYISSDNALMKQYIMLAFPNFMNVALAVLVHAALCQPCTERYESVCILKIDFLFIMNCAVGVIITNLQIGIVVSFTRLFQSIINSSPL